jgi:hypothetical protein
MPKLIDEPCSLQGIEPREHHTRPAGGFSGQRVYPFKAMVLGDFFRLHTAADALKTRNALKTFYRARQERWTAVYCPAIGTPLVLPEGDVSKRMRELFNTVPIKKTRRQILMQRLKDADVAPLDEQKGVVITSAVELHQIAVR